MKSMKMMLLGIVFILASLFCMAICILRMNTGDGPALLAIILFVLGLLTAGVGFFMDKEKDEDE